MNIFIIPSWYPTKESPITGHFFKEQALLYAAEFTQDNIAVSRWGQGEFIVDLLSPVKATKKIFSYFRASVFEASIADNATEFYSPAIEIRPRKYTGDMPQIVKANIKNFEKARRRYGHIDIIHAHVSFPAGFIASKLSKKFGIPYVLTEHMGPFPFPFYLDNGILLPRLAAAFKGAASIIAVSEFLKSEMKKYSIKANAIIPDFIDDDFFVPIDKIPNNQFVFFALGRITKEKGIDVVLKAFSMAFANKPDVFLKMGGVGADIKEMLLLANKLNITSKIEWLGELDRYEVRSNIQGCDAFVVASEYETFGVSVSEALCCGKPIVSTKCGGVEDMLDNNNSILTQVGSVDEMCAAMQKMYNDISLIDSAAIRKTHVLKFGKSYASGKLREVYINVLGNK